MEKTINFKKEAIKAKMNNLKNSAKKNVSEFLRWVKENPEEAVALGLVSYKIMNTLEKGYSKHCDRLIEKAKKLRVYDPSMGNYLYLKRAPSSKELDIILARKAGGEKLTRIYKDLNLIKTIEF